MANGVKIDREHLKALPVGDSDWEDSSQKSYTVDKTFLIAAKSARENLMSFALVSIALCCSVFADSGETICVDEFQSPPRVYGPHVWWHWMNGNICKEGLTQDLEAMAETGIDGATLFDVDCGIPQGPVKFDTPEFYDCVRHAAREAKRLGINLGVANSSGWANSGGPWVTPEDAMKYVTVSETEVEGPSRFEGILPRTQDDHGFYEDIAVLAVKDHSWPIDAAVSITGLTATATTEKPTVAGGVSWRIDFDWIHAAQGEAKVEVSDDGVNFRTLETFPFTVAYFNTDVWNVRRHTFRRPVTFRAMRLTVASKCKIKLMEFRPEAEQRLTDLDAKTYRYKMPFAPSVIDEPDGSVLRTDETIDLTARTDRSGRLVWEAPAGKWKILRIGYRANGKWVSQSGTPQGRGPEVDKLNAAAIRRHFDRCVGKMKRLAEPYGDAITFVLNDSYEAESQNWTRGLEREFAKRKGYSLIPYLPVFSGRIVESIEESERFLTDFRAVLSDMFAQIYAKTLLEKAHEYGMEFHLEAYGNGPSDDFTYGRYCDVPMAEFWGSARTDSYYLDMGPIHGNVDAVVKAADEWGHSIVGAEAFTSGFSAGRWKLTPHSLKCQGDLAYFKGVNRLTFHRFCHQPFAVTRYPGMTMGPWGMHFDRTQTWWPEAKEYVRYLTRCQYMLQKGRKLPDGLCHRRDTFADWYFVTSTNTFPVTVEKRFPTASGLVPEIWFPESGACVRAADWRVEGGETVVTLRLPTAGSAFVVFRSSDPDLPRERVLVEKSRQPLDGPWHVTFKSPAGCEPEPKTFETLTDWTTSDDRALKYFSGSATYEKTVTIKKTSGRILLDLGCVRDFATVKVGARELPAMWKPPFVVDITEAIESRTMPCQTDEVTFKLAVKITNRWPNRLIGDDALPEAERKTWTSWPHWKKAERPLSSGLLGPVVLRTMTVK